jgi:FMN phosphatase YigB (HAD superfamily)
MLAELPQHRFIFTNADSDHAQRVIRILGLDGCFDGIIDIRAIDFACKPEPAAYERALLIAGSPYPGVCLMLDDSISNLKPAHQMGITTVLVCPDGNSSPGADFTIAQISDLRRVLPDLWDGHTGGKPVESGADGS